MQKIKLIPIILIVEFCTLLPESIGKINEIIVFASPEDKIMIEPLLSDLFSHVIHTPQTEQSFILKYRYPWELQSYEKYGNIIMASLDFPEDSTADALTQRILGQYSQDSQLLMLNDLYAKNQLFFTINALDGIEFENLLRDNSEWILAQYYTSFNNKMMHEVFKKGKNIDLSKRIFHTLGHTIDLQPDFKLIRSDSLHSFVWVGRGYPYRWITLHMAKKDSYLNARSSWDQIKNDFELYMPEIIISNYFQKNEKVSYGRKQIPVMRGIYEHSESDTGGPFFVYIFDTEQANELILISGFVNYPGHEKLLLLKQLEIMAITLHKGEPV